MKLKPVPFEIPPQEPFRNDVLGRQPLAEALTAIVTQVTPPFVLGLDAAWGRGKTTFLHMWKAHLAGQPMKVLYFNAWETDFAADPLVAFVSEIGSLVEQESAHPQAKKRVRAVKRLGAKILKRAVPVAAKLATAGVLDGSELGGEAAAGLAEELAKDAVEAFEQHKKLIKEFHSELQGLIDSLPAGESAPRLLVLIDELDRCRPSYALELLERIKHLLNVPNVVFVLAIDRQQLLTSIETAYGARTDSAEYLRRFVDLEFELGEPDSAAFTEYLFGQFEFGDFFARRTHAAFRYDLEHLKETFNSLSEVMSLNLRAREQCFARLHIALLVTPGDRFLYPDVLVTLIILYTRARSEYRRFVAKSGTVSVLVGFLSGHEKGPAYLQSTSGTLLEAFLIAAKRADLNAEIPEWTEHQQVASQAGSPATNDEQVRKKRSQDIVNYVDEMQNRRGQVPLLRHITPLVELGVRLE
jgi:hypothetical protein